MRRGEMRGPSLFSSSVDGRDAAGEGILATLAARPRHRRGLRSSHGYWLLAGVAAVLAIAVLAQPARQDGDGGLLAARPAAPAARAPNDTPSPAAPLAPEIPDAAEAAPAQIIDLVKGAGPSSVRALADVPAAPPLPEAVPPAQAGASASQEDEPLRARPRASALRPAEAAPAARGRPSAERNRAAAEVADGDVRLLAALMRGGESSGQAEPPGDRALRQCAVLAPSDREACIALLCINGRAPLASCEGFARGPLRAWPAPH